MRRRILILGAGFAQNELIEYCRDSGMEVFGCSWSDQDPGVSLFDHFAEIDVTDRRAVLDYARKKRIDYIYSIASDVAMPTVGYVSGEMDIPSFVSFETASAATDKERMRRRTEGNQWSVPYACLKSQSECAHVRDFPVMVKPVDSQGQRGVSRADDLHELEAAYVLAKAHSKRGVVIAEKCISGQEVSVNGFFHGGALVWSAVTDRHSFREFSGGLPQRHTIPSIFHGTAVEERILELVDVAAKQLGISEGPVYAQIIVSGDQPFLIEISPRLDGCHLWRLIREYCGVDLLDMTMKALQAMGEEEAPKAGEPGEKSGSEPLSLEFFCDHPGEDFDQKQFSQLPYRYRSFYYQDGERIRQKNGVYEKCGYRIVDGRGE